MSITREQFDEETVARHEALGWNFSLRAGSDREICRIAWENHCRATIDAATRAELHRVILDFCRPRMTEEQHTRLAEEILALAPVDAHRMVWCVSVHVATDGIDLSGETIASWQGHLDMRLGSSSGAKNARQEIAERVLRDEIGQQLGRVDLQSA